jgi:hypothetical protein
VTATFASSTSDTSLTIAATAGVGGSIDPAGITTVPRGGSLTYTFTPNPGYRVLTVKAEGTMLEAIDSYTFTDVQFNKKITVTFTPITYAVTASAGTNGSIWPAGTTPQVQGTSPTYQITPAAGYHVADVVVDGSSIGAVTSHTFDSISSDHTISASFAANPTYTIEASFTGSGTVTPAGTITVTGGANQAYSFAPAAGYRIGSVNVDGANIGTPTGHTFYNVSAGHTLVVNFVEDTLAITASAGTGGSISPPGVTNVPRGTSQTYDITVNPGYRIYAVKVNGASKGAITSYTFSDVQTTQKISVTFAKQ